MKLPKKMLPLLSAVVMVAVAGCGKSEEQVAMSTETPAIPVTVVTLEPQRATVQVALPARAVAFRKAEVRPQVSGVVQQRLFTEGAVVEAGQSLYQIDAARFAAAEQTARANLARARANLSAAEAREARYRDLNQQKAVSQQDYDDALAAFEQSKAEVAVAEAALATAEIDLRYTQVTAPISGHIGKSAVSEGTLVSAQQQEVLATIHQLDPIYVDMSQSSSHVLNLRQQILSGQLSQQDAPKVEVILEDGSVYPHKGELQFSEMHINASTGTVMIRALVPNPDNLLLPGAFVRVKVNEGVQEDALLVPQRAVTYNRGGDATALVVNNDDLVELRSLSVSRSIGRNWLVDAGLQAGDRVIVEGLQKVKPGAKVSVAQAAAVTQAGE